MFQDIGDHKFDNSFKIASPSENDYMISYTEGKALACVEGFEESSLKLPTFAEMEDFIDEDCIYLFSVDETKFFLLKKPAPEFSEYTYHHLMELRSAECRELTFAAVTACHLAYWYEHTRYCGKCGSLMSHKEDERAMKCSCGNVVYPTISPVVIVGVTDGDRLLLTRYSAKHGGYRRHALNAGFMEIGETPEDTVRREVKEEVGLEVDNIRYFNSQPWGFSNSMLLGFFADAVGENKEPVPDDDELSEAVWYDREDIPIEDGGFSLTWTMIAAFKDGKIN